MVLMRLLRAWIKDSAALRGVRVRPIPPLAAAIAPVGLLAPLAGVLLFGLAVGAGSLLVAGSALAEMAFTLIPLG